MLGKFGENTEIRAVYDEDLIFAKDLLANTSQPSADNLNNKLYNSGSAGTFKSADYTKPKKGTKDQAVTSFKILKNRKLLAFIHSHGAYDPKYDNNNFSKPFIDPSGAKMLGDIGSYLATKTIGYVTKPNGSLRKYIPFDKKDILLNSNMPSDTNDSTHNPSNTVIDNSAPVIIRDECDE